VSRKSQYHRKAEADFEFEVKKGEAETKGETLDRQDEAPPRTAQEIPSAPGLPF
jgi:hypothetical protein